MCINTLHILKYFQREFKKNVTPGPFVWYVYPNLHTQMFTQTSPVSIKEILRRNIIAKIVGVLFSLYTVFWLLGETERANNVFEKSNPTHKHQSVISLLRHILTPSIYYIFQHTPTTKQKKDEKTNQKCCAERVNGMGGALGAHENGYADPVTYTKTCRMELGWMTRQGLR